MSTPRRSRVLWAAALLAALALCFAFSSSAFAATDYVVDADNAGGCFSKAPTHTSIQAAIADAASGDTIYVCNGNYYGNIYIRSKALTIQGESRSGVKIFAATGTPGPTVYGLDVQGVDVTLKGFSLWGPYHDSGYGIHVAGPGTIAVVDDIAVYNSSRTNINFNSLASVTLTNSEAHGAKWGNGVGMSDVLDITMSNITTSGNRWGGIAIYTKGNYFPPFPGGTDKVTLSGAFSLAEPIQLYVEMDGVGSPAVYRPVNDADFGGIFPFLVTNSGSATQYYAFAKDSAAANTTASALATKFGGTSSTTDLGAGKVDFVMAGAGIQAEINEAAAGDTIIAGWGAFGGGVTIDKAIELIGSGNGALAANSTHILQSGLFAVDIKASGASAAYPLLLKNLRIKPVDGYGVTFNSSHVSTAMSPIVEYRDIKLDGVHIVGTASTAPGENEFCFYVPKAASVIGLTVENSAFNSCDHGMLSQQDPTYCGVANNAKLDTVKVVNTVFRDNGGKGLYFEKLSNAEFTNVLVANNGLIWNASGNPPFNGGFDINLKYSDYSNIDLNNVVVVGNGKGFREGMGVGIKARDDGPSYNTCPATLDDVIVDGGAFVDNERGIRIGEPGKVNAGPTNVVIKNAAIYLNVPIYQPGNPETPPIPAQSATGDLIVTSNANVDAKDNWWGQATGPAAGQVKSLATPTPAAVDTSTYKTSYTPGATLSVPTGSRTLWTEGKSPWRTGHTGVFPPRFIDVPVQLGPFANQVSGLVLGVDYDEACLDYASNVNPPAGFTALPEVDLVNGKVKLSFVDMAPPVTVLSGTDFVLRFTLKSSCGDGPRLFSFDTSLTSCADTAGYVDVPCTTSNGTITLNVNEAPASLAISDNMIDENQAPPAAVGTLSASDPDGDALVYSLESDTALCGAGTYHNALFTVAGNVLQAAKMFDYETEAPNTYNVCVRVVDSRGGILNQALTINVVDVATSAALALLDDLDSYHNVVREGSPTPLRMPISFNSNGYAPLTNLTFKLTLSSPCLQYNGTDSIVAGGTVSESPAGTLNFTFLNPPTGSSNIVVLKFNGMACPNSLRTNVSLSFSEVHLYSGAFEIGEITSTGNTARVIENSNRGDCNATGNINAADLVAGVLEIFDVADGSHMEGPPPVHSWLEAPYSTFAGSPYGCDANANGWDEVGDVSCTVNVVFGNTACTTPVGGGVTAASTGSAVLSVPGAVDAGSAVKVPITFEAMGNAVAALSFSLDFDPAKVVFDPTDADADGLPDALAFDVKGNLLKVAVYDAESHILRVAVAGVSVPMPAFADGSIATVTLNSVAGGKNAVQLVEGSAGSTDGYNVPVILKTGDAVLLGSRILLPTVSDN